VKVDAEDFRRVYESMNDDALLAVNRDELVEVAQQCYDAEVARRNLLTVDEAEAAGEAAADEETDIRKNMVELAVFTNVDDARMALGLLRAAEIPCYLENIGVMVPEFRLSVPPMFLEQAREILDAEISEEELAAQAEAAAELELEEELEEEEEEEEEAP
jgi:hypothetical protein